MLLLCRNLKARYLPRESVFVRCFDADIGHLDGVPNGYAENNRTKEVKRWKARRGFKRRTEKRTVGRGG
jgi:hypothetical protein